VFNGLINDAYIVRYNPDETCNSHERFDEIVALDQRTTDTPVGALLAKAKSDLGSTAILEFNQEILTDFYCPACDRSQAVYRPVGLVLEREANCPECGVQRKAMKSPSIAGSERFLDRTLADIGVPPFDIVAGRRGLKRIGYEFSLDAQAVLGGLNVGAVPQGGTS
jgi:rubredoxin